MGRLYIEIWSKYINETGMLSFEEKVKLFLSPFSHFALFLLISGISCLIIGAIIQPQMLMTIGAMLLSVLVISIAVDFRKNRANDPLENIDFVYKRASTMVPRFLELLKISDSELPTVLRCIKEYNEVLAAKERSASEKLFSFSICGLMASGLVLAFEFLQKGLSEWAFLLLVICILIGCFSFFILVALWVIDTLRPTAMDKTRLIIRYLECYLIHTSCINTELQNRSVSE